MRREFFGASSPTSFRDILANVNETQRCYASTEWKSRKQMGQVNPEIVSSSQKSPDSTRIGGFCCIGN